jgi:hypothetical protein
MSHLPFGDSKAASKASKDDETSLTTLLSADQCADLTFLIATITASMRKALLATFTAEEVSVIEPQPNPKDDTTVEGEKQNEDQLKKERKEREEDARKELAKPEVQELKKQVLIYFDEWRGRVIVRVGETVNSREEAKQQSESVKESDVEASAKGQDTGLTSISDVASKGENEDVLFKELYPPFPTSLTDLDKAKRALILHSLVLILLSLVSRAQR